MHGDSILIKNYVNGDVEVDEIFEDVYNDNIYTVIDKQYLGESIGRELLDDDPDKDYMDNCHIIYEEIDKTINGIVNDIFGYVEEYLYNNQ